MHNSRILIVGCGDIGIPLGCQLVDEGAEVWGLRRNPGPLPGAIHAIAADVTDPASLVSLARLEFDYAVITLTPAGFTEQGYRSVFVDGMRQLLAVLAKQPRLRRVLHVSSTSVYHQHAGEWVDETSATAPTSFSGKALLEGEQLLVEAPLASTVVRFAGIYGPGRRRLIEQVLRGEGCPQEPPLYTNRIHRDDCVGVLKHLLQRDFSGEDCEPLYIGVDSEPVALWEVKQWLAALLGVSLSDTAAAAPGKTLRRNSKRCSNRRLLASGYRLQYPDFRAGYRSMLTPG